MAPPPLNASGMHCTNISLHFYHQMMKKLTQSTHLLLDTSTAIRVKMCHAHYEVELKICKVQALMSVPLSASANTEVIEFMIDQG